MQENSYRVTRAVTIAACVTFWNTAGVGAQPPAPLPLMGAESFAVLARTSVANSGASTIAGDVGVGAGGAISGLTTAMLAPGSTLHQGDAVAAQALQSAAATYAELVARACPAGPPPVLDGATLAPGVYCFPADAVLNTTLTLSGTGPWIFKVAGALTVAPAAQVVAPPMPPATCSGSGIYWQVGDTNAATAPQPVTIGAGAVMRGNLLAQGAVALGAAASLDGRAVSLGEGASGGSVTLAANTVAACSFGQPLPTAQPFKVTGGGGINVPDPPVSDPDATGSGFANYGFNGMPGAGGAPGTGHFNYVNHAVAANRHVNGPVTDVDIVALNPDGSPRTARLSGTCDGFLPSCTFSVLTEDNGEPGRNDRFGIVVVSAGQVVEARSLRVVRNGNIQFHSAALTTSLNTASLRPGQTLRLSVRLRGDATNTPADAYVVLQMPGGALLSWTGQGLVPGLVPVVRNFVPVNLDAEVLVLPIPAGTPPGVYTWLTALTEAGTLNLITPIASQTFTVTP
jgi:hypothetical protein